MALINGIYVFVEDESLDMNLECTEHPVEEGTEITDHIQRKSVEITLKGKIVDYDDTLSWEDSTIVSVNATTALDKLKQLQKSGSLITYVGRNAQSNLQIQSFSTTHPNTVWGGCEFDMTLKELRVAQPAYTEDYSAGCAGTQQVEQGENGEIYHIVKLGDKLWNLVSENYKILKPFFSSVSEKCAWVMEQNPHAFSVSGDIDSLMAGEKILMGLR